VCVTSEMMQQVEDSAQTNTCPMGSLSTRDPTLTGLRLNPALCGLQLGTNCLSYASVCRRHVRLLPALQPSLSVATDQVVSVVTCPVTSTIMFAGTTRPRVRERTTPVWISPNAAAKPGRQASVRHFVAVLALG
jgi:hypothetical protein